MSIPQSWRLRAANLQLHRPTPDIGLRGLVWLDVKGTKRMIAEGRQSDADLAFTLLKEAVQDALVGICAQTVKEDGDGILIEFSSDEIVMAVDFIKVTLAKYRERSDRFEAAGALVAGEVFVENGDRTGPQAVLVHSLAVAAAPWAVLLSSAAYEALPVAKRNSDTYVPYSLKPRSFLEKRTVYEYVWDGVERGLK